MKSVGAAIMAGALGLANAQEAAPPAAPEADTRPPREFVIFFDHAGPWIPEGAQAVIPQVAEIYQRVGYAAIGVDCYSDNVGSQDLNLALTKDRANRIKTDLVRYKVPEAAIAASGHGFADPLVEGMPLDTAVSNSPLRHQADLIPVRWHPGTASPRGSCRRRCSVRSSPRFEAPTMRHSASAWPDGPFRAAAYWPPISSFCP